jgi:hypothetical protein
MQEQEHVEKWKKAVRLNDARRVLAGAQNSARGEAHSTHLPRSHNRASRLRRAVVSVHFIFCSPGILEQMFASEYQPIASQHIII